jgi:hypothetical protein
VFSFAFFLVFFAFFTVFKPIHACLSQDENFDGYPPASDLDGLNGWQGWDDDPAFSASVSSTQSKSPSQSVDIIGPSDLVQPFCVSGGEWSYPTTLPLSLIPSA